LKETRFPCGLPPSYQLFPFFSSIFLSWASHKILPTRIAPTYLQLLGFSFPPPLKRFSHVLPSLPSFWGTASGGKTPSLFLSSRYPPKLADCLDPFFFLYIFGGCLHSRPPNSSFPFLPSGTQMAVRSVSLPPVFCLRT